MFRRCDFGPAEILSLKIALRHFARDIVGLADGQCHDGERRVLRRPGGELAAIRHEQVLDVVRLTPCVDDTIPGIFTHAVGAEVVGRGIGRRAVDFLGAGRLIDRSTLLEGMFAHGQVIGVIVEMDVGHRHAMLIFLRGMQ